MWFDYFYLLLCIDGAHSEHRPSPGKGGWSVRGLNRSIGTLIPPDPRGGWGDLNQDAYRFSGFICITTTHKHVITY